MSSPSLKKAIVAAIQNDSAPQLNPEHEIQRMCMQSFVSNNPIFSKLELTPKEFYIVVNADGLFLREEKRTTTTVTVEGVQQADFDALTFGDVTDTLVVDVDEENALWRSKGIVVGSLVTHYDGTKPVKDGTLLRFDSAQTLVFEVPAPYRNPTKTFIAFLRSFLLKALHPTCIEITWADSTYYLELEAVQEPGQIELGSTWEPINYKADKPSVAMSDLIAVRYDGTSNPNDPVDDDDVVTIEANSLVHIKLVDKKLYLAVVNIGSNVTEDSEQFILATVSKEGRPALRIASKEEIWYYEPVDHGNRTPKSPANSGFYFDPAEIQAYEGKEKDENKASPTGSPRIKKKKAVAKKKAGIAGTGSGVKGRVKKLAVATPSPRKSEDGEKSPSTAGERTPRLKKPKAKLKKKKLSPTGDPSDKEIDLT